MKHNLKILVIAREIPYPANHGGRVETWNRLVALSQAGVKLQLVTWSDQKVTDEHRAIIANIVDDAIILSRRRWPILAFHPYYPSGVVSRTMSSSNYHQLLQKVRFFAPEVIFLDGLDGCILGLMLANDLGRAIVYRSHNVEHQYVSTLCDAEKNILRKTLLWLNKTKTFKIEKYVREKCNLVYDISEEDASSWRDFEEMTSKTKVLPTYFFLDFTDNEINQNDNKEDFDVLYIGNLFSPNNLFGLRWFIKEVSPFLQQLRIAIAGSNPREEILSLAREHQIHIIANPPDIRPLYKRARVLINPVWHGSGVNIKMIEMLSTGKPVVSTSQGIHGLVSDLRVFVAATDDPQDFACLIKDSLHKTINKAQFDAVRKIHDYTQVNNLIEELKLLVK